MKRFTRARELVLVPLLFCCVSGAHAAESYTLSVDGEPPIPVTNFMRIGGNRLSFTLPNSPVLTQFETDESEGTTISTISVSVYLTPPIPFATFQFGNCVVTGIVANSGSSTPTSTVSMSCATAGAQNVSIANHIDFGNEASLDSLIIGATGGQTLFLSLTAVSPSPQGGTFNNDVTLTAFQASSSGADADVVSLFAGYAVLAGAVTPNYASYVAAFDEVVITFVEGNSNHPIVAGGAFNASQPLIGTIALGSALDVASESLLQGLSERLPDLFSRFNLTNPLVAPPAQACKGTATQLDVDSKGDLLVRVFGNAGAPIAGVIVIASVTSTSGAVSFEATTDANGLAQFNGPGNTVPLGTGAEITGIGLQLPGATGASICVVQGNPIPPVDISSLFWVLTPESQV